MQYIRRIGEGELYSDSIGKVALYDLSRCNTNQESRIECVTHIAGVCYGQDRIKNAEKLYKRLVDENASTLEFVRAGDPWQVLYQCQVSETAEEDKLFGIATSLRNCPNLPTDEEWTEKEGSIGKAVLPEELHKWHKEEIATFLIKIPIFVARQVMRHRTMSFQELSRRYTTDKRVPLEFWVSNHEAITDADFRTESNEAIKMNYDEAADIYEALIAAGVRAEIARAVLPVSLYTQFWLMGNAPAFKNYFKLRLDKHTQKEHRELAEAMLELLKEHQPTLYEKVRP